MFWHFINSLSTPVLTMDNFQYVKLGITLAFLVFGFALLTSVSAALLYFDIYVLKRMDDFGDVQFKEIFFPTLLPLVTGLAISLMKNQSSIIVFNISAITSLVALFLSARGNGLKTPSNLLLCLSWFFSILLWVALVSLVIISLPGLLKSIFS